MTETTACNNRLEMCRLPLSGNTRYRYYEMTGSNRFNTATDNLDGIGHEQNRIPSKISNLFLD